MTAGKEEKAEREGYVTCASHLDQPVIDQSIYKDSAQEENFSFNVLCLIC